MGVACRTGDAPGLRGGETCFESHVWSRQHGSDAGPTSPLAYLPPRSTLRSRSFPRSPGVVVGAGIDVASSGLALATSVSMCAFIASGPTPEAVSAALSCSRRWGVSQSEYFCGVRTAYVCVQRTLTGRVVRSGQREVRARHAPRVRVRRWPRRQRCSRCRAMM